MVQLVGHTLHKPLERHKIEDIGVLVERPLDSYAKAVVMPMQQLDLVAIVGHKVPGGEHQVVAADVDAVSAHRSPLVDKMTR
jgi:hypothetical protein